MKKKQLTSLVFVVAVVCIALALRLWPRTLSPEQCSDAYRHYADVEGVKATFIKNKQLNDSVTSDVTILEALDSAGWDTLVYDFRLEKLINKDNFIFEDAHHLGFKGVPKGNYRAKMDTSNLLNNDFIVMSLNWHTVMVFNLESEKQYYAIFDYIFKIGKTTDKP